MIERILIAGGGTGGHVYPAGAVAEEVLARRTDASVVFVGTEHGMEARIVPGLGYQLATISASRLVGTGLVKRIKGLALLVMGIWQSLKLLRRHRPQVVLGMGGYASGPALLAAWMCRYPTAIQEQNATPGLTNRVLGRLVRAVYLGFSGAQTHFSGEKTKVTGNPLRRAVVNALNTQAPGRDARSRPFSILVFGGSQGARFLNEHVPVALGHLHHMAPDLAFQVVHQTGPADEAITRTRYEHEGLSNNVKVLSYIEDMPRAYEDADLALCRAGALTVAEITAVALPSLLVPFPHAAGNHQEANAQALVTAGAARMTRQDEWSNEEVGAYLRQLAQDPQQLKNMSDAAHSLSHTEAAASVVDHLEAMILGRAA